MTDLLTTSQAARRMQVPVHMVKKWAQLGLIANHGAGGKGSVALWEWEELRTAPGRRMNLRARGICTEPACDQPHWAQGQCAHHYQRSRREAGLVKSAPSTPTRNAEQTLRKGRMPTAPRSLPYRALAVSCPECGMLRTTADHLLRRDAGPLPACPKCRVMRVKRHQRQRAAVDDEYRRKMHKRVNRNRKRANDALADTARNNGKQWTGPELEIVAREDLTARQAAVMLGRTMYAVKHMRRAIRVDPRKDRLANLVTHDPPCASS